MKTEPLKPDLPDFGILLTTYNGQEFLREQLDSILVQIGVSVHVYVFDDCSSDLTMNILFEYSEKYAGKFSVTQNSTNSGGTGLNIFRNVDALPEFHDFVALADQDDVWLPEKLIRAVETMANEHSDLYFSNLMAWDGKETIMGIVRKDFVPKKHDHLFAGGSAGCTYVLSRDFFSFLKLSLSAVSLSDVKRISHDWIIYFLARHNGFNVSASSDASIKYRIHTNSQYGGMSLGGFRAVFRKFKMLNSGFMNDQVENSLRFARGGTEDRAILEKFKKGRLSRIAVLMKYRFSLVRQNTKFISLFLAFALLK